MRRHSHRAPFCADNGREMICLEELRGHASPEEDRTGKADGSAERPATRRRGHGRSARQLWDRLKAKTARLHGRAVLMLQADRPGAL